MPITITARRDGFRRCGRAHPARPTTYPDGFWTPEQLATLRAEPMLIVREESGVRSEELKSAGAKRGKSNSTLNTPNSSLDERSEEKP